MADGIRIIRAPAGVINEIETLSEMTSEKSIFDELVRQTATILGVDKTERIGREDSLKSLGANSMDRADIIMVTLEQLQVKTSLAELAKASSLGELAALIHAKKASA